MFAPIDDDISDFTEEIVVTIDHIDDAALVDDSLQTVDSLSDSLSLVQTAISSQGGQLLPDDITYSEKPSSVFVFKDPNFIHSSKGPGGNKRTRVWKNLKQIIAAERALPWGPDDVTYGSIDAPPSFKPAKKYSDISGLEARYTDPQTKMRYANADEYRRVHLLPGDIIAGCLHLRKANTLVP
uniref:Vps72/YL1 C-terminal domain-containing protein n=1 Tax=Arion vulgaris TaxID=1028688 RepID=A0A0B6ZRZ5_9EUPU